MRNCAIFPSVTNVLDEIESRQKSSRSNIGFLLISGSLFVWLQLSLLSFFLSFCVDGRTVITCFHFCFSPSNI